MNGLSTEKEYRAVAEACGEEQFALEPTGGIDKNNFEAIVKIALQANVPQIIPHVYSSIINKETGTTNVADVRDLFLTVKKLVDHDG
ncbi:oxo-acid lyase, partial [Gracilibacillus oryzae]